MSSNVMSPKALFDTNTAARRGMTGKGSGRVDAEVKDLKTEGRRTELEDRRMDARLNTLEKMDES
jgi:hypothetical protein